MNKTRIWNPLCITKDREFGHSTLGYITPCCWNDPVFAYPYHHRDWTDVDKALFTEDLKIANNDSIEDILLSEAWQTFYDTIDSGPENASKICKRYCNRLASAPTDQVKVMNLRANPFKGLELIEND
jgi:hypothetical protein